MEEEEEEDYEDEMIDDNDSEDLEENMNINNNIIISDIKIGNPFYNIIQHETKKMVDYLVDSINKFPKIFDKNTFDEALKHLEKISIENTCVCSAVINNQPAWRCVDCCEYDSAILCSHCYKKSKNLHKNHKVYYLYTSGGMCDCGDPDSLTTFCTEHRGPYSDQNEIDNYISSIFSKELMDKLKIFFDEFFLKFSKYFILTSKCDLFCESTFKEYFNDIIIDNNNEKKNDLFDDKNNILSIKQTFCDLFLKMLNFFRAISSKNLAMFFLLATYFLKNHFKDINIEEKDKDLDEYKVDHPCIKISQNDIEILYKNDGDDYNKMEIEEENNNNNIIINKNKHICECPFFRLLLINWRDNVNNKKDIEFFLSFARHLPLKKAFCILFFFDYNQLMLNNNKIIIDHKSQFFSEDTMVLIAEKTNLIEESFDIFYNIFYKKMKKYKLLNNFYSDSINDLYRISIKKEDTLEYCSKPKIKKLMSVKKSMIKKIIDCICLIHNEVNFKSIFPHPQFQNKGYYESFFDLEGRLLSILQKLIIMTKWDDIEIIKEIFEYNIYKIINQKSEGIKQLNEDEYSFHLTLYRSFGLLMNYFCFYYALSNKCSIIESINFFKEHFFKSQNEINILADIVLNDYFKLFGFIGGTKNNFFNYYNEIYMYHISYLYFNDNLKKDFTLLKYLLIMSENNYSLSSFLKKSNIENTYALFEKIFLNKENNENNENKMIIEEVVKGDNINDILNQWIFLMELLINFIKDDSSPFFCFIDECENVISLKTKNDLFENIRNNKDSMVDLENVLKEQIIHGIVAEGNLIDIEKIKKDIDSYLLTLFGETKFNDILNDLTLNKINNGKKFFYLKDSNLKYLDMNYYSSPKDKSNAQKYILEFKKDIIKSYNNYYYNPSKLIFDFFTINL